MAKFSPGDPVWSLSHGRYRPAGEHPAVILRLISVDEFCYCECRTHSLEDCYVITETGLPGLWCNHECRLRPRRDDYQQHEKRGSMDEVFTPKLDERSLELACDAMKEAKEDAMARGRLKAFRFALMYSADPDTIRRMFKRAP